MAGVVGSWRWCCRREDAASKHRTQRGSSLQSQCLRASHDDHVTTSSGRCGGCSGGLSVLATMRYKLHVLQMLLSLVVHSLLVLLTWAHLVDHEAPRSIVHHKLPVRRRALALTTVLLRSRAAGAVWLQQSVLAIWNIMATLKVVRLTVWIHIT